MRCCQACTRHAQASAGDFEQTGAHHVGIFPTQRGSIALFPLEIRRSPLNCGWARRLCSLAGMRGSEGRPIPLLPSEDRGGHRRLAPGPAGWQPRRKRRRRFLLPRTSNCDPPRPAHLCPSRERGQSPSSLPGARMSSTLAWMKNLDTLWRGAANVGKCVCAKNQNNPNQFGSKGPHNIRSFLAQFLRCLQWKQRASLSDRHLHLPMHCRDL